MPVVVGLVARGKCRILFGTVAASQVDAAGDVARVLAWLCHSFRMLVLCRSWLGGLR